MLGKPLFLTWPAPELCTESDGTGINRSHSVDCKSGGMQKDADSWITAVYDEFSSAKNARETPDCWEEVEALYEASTYINTCIHIFSLSVENERRLTRDRTAELVSRDQILRHERG